MTSTDITVERIYPQHFVRIEDALRDVNSPALLGYHTPAYMSMLTPVLHDNPLYLAASVEGRIAGFMPLRWRTGSLGPVINGLPFFGPNGGPIITGYGRSFEDIIMKCLAGELMRFAKELDAVSVVCYTPFLAESEAFENSFAPERIIDRCTQYLGLDGFAGWSSHIRHKSVGRAKAQGVTTRLGTQGDIETFITLYHEHYNRKGLLLKPDEYLYRVVDTLCPLGIARFTVAEWRNAVVACLITIQAGITISYNVPCCAEYALTTQANSLLIDESVRALSSCGYRFWNWEASAGRENPVYKFKARWGSHERGYRILIKYPKGVEVFLSARSGDIAATYPYYFVIPYDSLGEN
jgi:hypothetical protein